MAESKKNMVSPVVRGSFVTVLEPRAIEQGSDPEYSMTLLLDKENDEHMDFLADLKDRMKDAYIDKIGQKGEDTPFSKYKHFPIFDGDDEDENKDPAARGHWCVRTKNKRQPGLLVMEEDGTRRAIERDSEIYSGAYYHVSLNPYGWNNSFGKGVSISLNGVLKVKDGEPLSGGFDESDFDKVSKSSKGRRDRDDDRSERRSRDRDDDRSERRSRDRDDDRSERRSRDRDDDRSERRSRDRDDDRSERRNNDF